TRKVVDAMAFEKACDYRFGRFRLVLKNLAAATIIPKEYFIDAVMHLEGIDPKIPELVTSAIKFNDIDTLMHLLDDHRADQRTIEEACDLMLPNSTRRALMEMDIPLDLIHEAILHLDGYYSHDIAAELHSTMQSLSGQELGEQVLDMLRDSSA